MPTTSTPTSVESATFTLLQLLAAPRPSVAALAELLGPIEQETASTFLLTPRVANIERAVLEKGEGLASQGLEISGVSLSFVSPVHFDRADLKAQFGAPSELPRLKPSQPRSIRYTVDRPGGRLLLVFGDAGDDARELKAMSIIARVQSPA